MTVSSSVSGRLTDTLDTLQVISNGPVVQAATYDGQYSKALPLFTAANATTGDITDSYGIIDGHGKIALSVSDNDSEKNTDLETVGQDFSQSKWFDYTRHTAIPYISLSSDSSDSSAPDGLIIAYPILDQNDNSFRGAVFAFVPFEKINSYTLQLSSSELASTGSSLIDSQGEIIASTLSANVNHNINDAQYLAAGLPMSVTDQSERTDFLKFMHGALDQNDNGVQDFVLNGNSATIAYSPVFVNNLKVLTAFTSVPYSYSLGIASTIEQQELVNAIFIAALGGSAIITSIIVLTWNRRLGSVVTDRTKELQESNELLQERTENLRIANQYLEEKSERLESMGKFLNELNEKLLVTNKELENANDQLRSHDAMQKEFINIAAHELRTPVQPLLGLAEILGHQFASNSRDNAVIETIEITKAELEMIVRNASRLERLSSDLLEVSRIESHTLNLKRTEVDLNQKISEVIHDMKTIVPKGKKLYFEFLPDSDGKLLVEADVPRLAEVLINLIGNAIKFTDKGGITISTKLIDANNQRIAQVSIRDTGTGIDSAIIPHLFKKFVSKSDYGTGLGLFISRNIVEAHGGKIWAENNPEGTGATFAFTLPVTKSVIV